jgi:LCP family protein required for cell wall assembly
MINNKSRRLSFHWFDLMMSAILVLMLLAALVIGIYLYQSIRLFVADSQLPIFPELNSSQVDLPSFINSDSVQATPVVTPKSVAEQQETEKAEEVEAETEVDIEVDKDKKPSEPPVLIDRRNNPRDREDDVPLPPPATERLTVLLMGIDRRNGEEGPWRTDSMIVITIDPETDSVAMLSVPRDLYLTMPNHGFGEFQDRINQAFFHGDRFEYPGGGPALAMQTIRRNFGMQVNRYLVIDFNGFERIIDEIGGIEIDVPELLIDHQYPTEDYGYMTVRFEPGLQTMDGRRTLIYSRTRKSTSDFARAERQQQVILAMRDKILSLDIISALTPSRLARLATALDDSIQTDLTLEEVLSVAQVAQRIESENINRLVIDPNMVNNFITSSGAQVLWPNWNIILPLTREVFDIQLLPIAAHPTSAPTRVPTRRPQPTFFATRPAQPTFFATRTAQPTFFATRTAQPTFFATQPASPTFQPTQSVIQTAIPTVQSTIVPTIISTVAPTVVPTQPPPTIPPVVERTVEAVKPTIPAFVPATTPAP